MLHRSAIALVFLASCSAPQHSAGAPSAADHATQPAPACRPGVVPADERDDWDPNFQSKDVDLFRGFGGFFVSLRAATIDQHRAGPSFRVECGQDFHGRLLLKVPANAVATYKSVFVAFLDYRQVPVTLNGTTGRTHRLALATGEEHIFDVLTGPLAEGIHRLVLIFFDDDLAPGLVGRYDMIADLYVGPDPHLALIPSSLPTAPTRVDPAVASSGYGVNLTSRADRLSLPPPVKWVLGLELYASFWGSVEEGDQPAALIVLDEFEELDLGRPHPYVLARAGQVSIVSFRPRAPERDVENLRVILFTNPALEIAPSFQYNRGHSFGAYTSQKAYVTR